LRIIGSGWLTTSSISVREMFHHLWTIHANNPEGDHNQINIYNGRGVLIESDVGPVWLYGTSAEHNVLYNYQISNASNVYMALIQTETPYFQSNPDAATPFTSNKAYNDPVFSGSTSANKAWGLRIVDSDDVFVYGAGLYSFFVSPSLFSLSS